MRLTTTDAGFLDATTVRPRKLVDFVLNQQETIQALGLAESFWQTNRREPLHARRWIAALHALYIAQAPQALQFEQFLYLYGALDTCFKLATDLHSPQTRRLPHHSRTRWLCDHFQIPLPTWADDSTGAPQIAKIRNTTIHESLFVDAPLGFAVHGRGTNQNLPLEMKALVCRLLVALLGAPDSDYVRSRLDTRQMHRWTPS
ncbi:hypothetical protein CKO32_16980 [Afifella marina DSM 2698]|nr:hypothetical protein [Afifella marina DSM 2698]MBK1628973.1 hypothetical protein [Afifella marina]MBK5918352.1 hypothetical protein [Afifella marina]RAI22867.1 hypothetical protein CH311_04240 [Afifella marina DSM 2698]